MQTPAICQNEQKRSGRLKRPKEQYANLSDIDFDRVQSSFGIALHMHQPTIPAATDDLRRSPLISNLQYMMEHQSIGDNHNAPVFLWCYSRISDFIKELVSQGKNPRVMLDYSGNLLWGLEQIDRGNAIGKLSDITTNKRYYENVEWLGTMWSHAVVTSTPVPDIELQMHAWRDHFASIFGHEALGRVKGFSPPEMHLPIHPDVCFEYIKTLKECGYEWLMVQEHTIENLDGSGIKRPHFPHRLIARNSLGEKEEITVLIKTQGSDTKLVAQMQPYYEAKSRGREDLHGRPLPPFVLQIGDGENGGVMMNEFPPCYKQAFQEIGIAGTVAMNGSEYLEFMRRYGADEKQYTPVQPISQHRIWSKMTSHGPGACDEAIKKIHDQDPNFNLDKGSWTNDKNWVKGYENVMDPIKSLSVMFHKKFDKKIADRESPRYKKALLYLLLSQSSDFRYWGQGIWTDYASEICRRGMEALG
ncbi:MAG: glycosyl hydrolase family 57 [Candidatus Omnitrophica bacterium]|nr:glycosyl hydrolase family 57 [Candidatus Omnitrophota bacterium]